MSARARIANRHSLGAFVAILALLGSAGYAAAQPLAADGSNAPGATPPEWNVPPPPPAPNADRPVEQRAVCAIGRAGERCASIFVLELTARGGNVDLSELDVGLLVNQGRYQAWGATIGAVGYEGAGGWLAKARYRRWLNSFVGLDAGVGAGSVGPYEYRRAAGVAEVAVELGDVIAFSAGLNTLPDPSTNSHRLAATAGVRLGLVPLLTIAAMLRR